MSDLDCQLRFYRDSVDAETEITRPRCYPRAVQFGYQYKLGRALEPLGSDLAGWSAVVVGAGSGMDSEYLARRGARVVATDISPEALLRARERSRRYGVAYELVVADAEHLPFLPGSVDLAFAHDCLHHAADPYAAIGEMAAVAARAVVVAEPADSPLTRLAVWLGLSGNFEDAGNFVYRLHPRRLRAAFAASGAPRCEIRQDLIYSQVRMHRIYRLFDRGLPFFAFRLAFRVVNALVGRWGNSLKAVAWKG